MDVLLKIRIAIWILVLALWGSLVYQFLYEDGPGEPGTQGRMAWIVNPFPKAPPPQPLQNLSSIRPQPPSQSPTPLVPKSLLAEASGRLASAAPPGRFIVPLQPRVTAPSDSGFQRRYTDFSLRRHELSSLLQPETPSGFVRSETDHFYVYSEGEAASRDFLSDLENLHGNLMLDLASFSPWAHDEKVSIYLFHNQDSYRRVTGRPAWSGGASSVSKRKIYLYESDELFSILAHEMTHIYFDGFFLNGKMDPLWLSEGMAVLEQIERGLSAPNWLPENLDLLYRGGGFKLDDLMHIDNTAGANDDNVRLWYTQSYSVVRFLVHSQWKSSFYHFCIDLRAGRPVQEALYRAYGMPFNRTQALEYAWRYDLTTHRITSLRASTR